MRTALDTRVSWLEGKESDRSLSVTLVVYSPLTVDEAFVVRHELGDAPDEVTVLADTHCTVRASEDDRKTWTADSILLRCSVAGVRLVLTIRATKGD